MTSKKTGKEAKTEAPKVPGKLTDDHPLYQKTLAILAGIREVRKELSEELHLIQAANTKTMFPAGFGERADIIEALDEGYRTMISDIRNAARSSGLGFPEDLR